MYRSFSAEQYKDYLGFSEEYKVDGVLCYGTLYERQMLNALKTCLKEMNIETDIKQLPDPFLRFAREIQIGNSTIWFMIGYGGAWLSEYLHWACLFGSKKNILVGSCGGLKKGMKPADFIVPTSSFAEESSVRIYNRDSPVQVPNQKLNDELSILIGANNTQVWRGPMVTCQAMIGETMDDVRSWSEKGYYGVEMEASTVFAVSNHFSVPSAASVYVGDNLIEEHSNMSKEFLLEADIRKQNQKKQIRAALELLIS